MPHHNSTWRHCGSTPVFHFMRCNSNMTTRTTGEKSSCDKADVNKLCRNKRSTELVQKTSKPTQNDGWSPHVVHCSRARGQPRVNLASKMHTRTRQPSHLPPSHNKLLVGTCWRKWPNKKTSPIMCLSRAPFGVTIRTGQKQRLAFRCSTGSHSPWWHQHVERREHFIRMGGPTRQELNLTWCTSER